MSAGGGKFCDCHHYRPGGVIQDEDDMKTCVKCGKELKFESSDGGKLNAGTFDEKDMEFLVEHIAFDSETCRKAMNAEVRKWADARVKVLVEALEAIKKHMVIVGGDMADRSTVYGIADKALSAYRGG